MTGLEFKNLSAPVNTVTNSSSVTSAWPNTAFNPALQL